MDGCKRERGSPIIPRKGHTPSGEGTARCTMQEEGQSHPIYVISEEVKYSSCTESQCHGLMENERVQCIIASLTNINSITDH